MILKPKDFELLKAFEKLTIEDKNLILSTVNSITEDDLWFIDPHDFVYDPKLIKKKLSAIEKFQLNTKIK